MKAIALFSGGLDSMIAIKLMTLQNIEVIALYMDNGFGASSDKFGLLEHRANEAGAKFHIIDIKQRYLQNVLFSPKFGYGKHFNPCIDCHGFMFEVAFEKMAEFGANFIISGEVLGQRPMSQRKEALNSVKHLSNGDESLILRPLCAKLLVPSKPEILGWVKREKLLNISGRSRNIQLNLAKKFGFSDFESPAGGCLLTLELFSNRIKNTLEFEKKFELDDMQMLRFGRHLRLENGAKMIIGRNEIENEALKNIKSDKFLHVEIDIIGAYSLISKNATLCDKNLAAKIAITYAKSLFDTIYEAKIDGEIFANTPFPAKSHIEKYLIK